MTNSLAIRQPIKPFALWKKSKAAHSRALGASMHKIPMVNEPAGIAALAAANDMRLAIKRRAIQWATWKGQKENKLPENIVQWHVAIKESGGQSAWAVTFEHFSNATGWQKIVIAVPAWQEAAPIEIIIEHESEAACDHTAALALDAPQAALSAPAPIAAETIKARPKAPSAKQRAIIWAKEQGKTLRYMPEGFVSWRTTVSPGEGETEWIVRFWGAQGIWAQIEVPPLGESGNLTALM